MSERWSARIGFVLLLLGGCTKSGPVELRGHELPSCGPVAELTEVGGRVYGVSDRIPISGMPTQAGCAFDIDTEFARPRVDALTWDGHAIGGGNAQMVDADGTQTIVASWLTDEGTKLHVGLLRRTPAGLEPLDSVERPESIIPPGKLDALRLDDRIVVGFTKKVHNPSCGNSYEEQDSHFIWRAGDELEEVPDDGTAERIRAVGDELLVAGIWGRPELGRKAPRQVRVVRLAASSDEPERRWVTVLDLHDGEARPARVLDVEILGRSVYVLSQGQGRVWLSRVSTDAGAIAWSLVGEGIVGELNPTRLGGVQVTTLARSGSEHTLHRFDVGESGDAGPTRTIQVPVEPNVVITTIAEGEGDRVWLGGYLERGEDVSTGWIGAVD